MFRRTEYVPYAKTVAVHEHRAPTDESVKMLAEMEQAAAERVIARVPLETALFTGEVMFHFEAAHDQLVATARAKINGTELRVRADIGRMPDRSQGWEWSREAMEKLAGELAKEISRHGLIETFARASAQLLSMPRI